MIILGEGKTSIPVRSMWFLLIYASELLAEMRAPERNKILAGERDEDLLDAIAEVLVVEVEQRLRRQLTLHYRTRHADLHRVRGRIDHLRSVTRRLSDQGRIACRFEELSVDSPRNRFIAHTLIYAAQAIKRAELAQRCRAAAFRMHRLGVGAVEPSRSELSRDRLAHHDAGDRRMLDAAHLLRDMAIPYHEQGLADLPALLNEPGKHRKLFEAAVRGFFWHTLSAQGWTIGSRKLHWKSEMGPTPTFLPVMKTDVTLDNPAMKRRIVIETKFTDALVDRDGKTTVASGYLYQLYAYLASQSGNGNAVADAAEGVLLFVKTSGRQEFTAETKIQGHTLRFMSVDLSAKPADIRNRWMQCMTTQGALQAGSDFDQ
ncbi:hypothetical protein A9W99_18620 [Mycobacterium sp. 1164966.3]|uniref:5-methylcytosine restriction system specificity protein McrC n=1 Tax=Mycobacterium sp. 1164966.3 TaxID=1856861 RepID=UPI00080096CF|nr:hypothetical protein [Mycobacterium sp. 1164966.3]OBA80111.1 hypothetical protein A9W99_18620 [Mycobacterium sp. 1164966.3]